CEISWSRCSRRTRRRSVAHERRKIPEALRDRIERIAGAGVLLDGEPRATGGFGGLDDRRHVEVARADLGVLGFALGVDPVVLQVDDRQAAGELAAPGDRVAAAVLDPVRVWFTLEVPRVRFLVNA